MKRTLLFASLAALAALTAAADHPTGNRITPPTVNSVTPLGAARGTTVEMTVEGLNLAGASGIYFNKPGVTGRVLRVKELPDLPDVRLGSNGTPSTIDLGPLPPRNQVTLELDISPDADVGPVSFRLLTPLGTSPAGSFLVEPYYGESPDREPNDSPERAFETYLPTVLTGVVSRPGDVDLFKIEVKAGEQIVFENGAMQIGSTLQPVLSILNEQQAVVREFGYDGAAGVSYGAHRFDKGGVYYLRVSDYQQSGRGGHFYRIKVGQLPLAVAAYPLGLEQGKEREVRLRGFHLGDGKALVKGQVSPNYENAVVFRPETPAGRSFYEVKLALGEEPEVESAGANVSAAAAQTVTAPVTVNGRIAAPSENVPVENYFRFQAHKGQKFVVEVNARRLGSELDSLIEILDAKGNPLERNTVRAVLETSTTLSERDSVQTGLRIQNWDGFAVGDYVLVGGEILRVQALPRTPDDDMRFDEFGGQRLAYFGTTTEAHAVDKPVYKVQVYPPGRQFTTNGLPLVKLYHRNDDGGPGYGKDSVVQFTAPADGDYLVRLRDVRGSGGEDHAYRLTIRAPRPDFRLSVTPRNPNIPRGGSIPITVTALRLDDYDGPIAVSLADLPRGVRATTGTIAPGQTEATLLLSAEAEARLEGAAPMRVKGEASIAGRTVARWANPDDELKLLALMPKPDILVAAETRELVLEPGGTGEVQVTIRRQNGFGGRVPVQIRNLPPRVRVLDVGLNGVLINEDENERSFVLEALPSAEPIEQVIYVAGNVETRSPLPTVFASWEPVVLKVKTAAAAAARTAKSGQLERSTAPK